MKKYEVLWLLVFLLCFLLVTHNVQADEFRYSSKLSPSDYLLKSHETHGDPVFDNPKIIELGVNLGVGSDCGRVDFKNTLKSSLQNVLDAKYFGNLGQDIIAASPMLLTCYFSPTWCAILKHSQVSANWLSQLRLDQCSIIDKYTDSRTEDYYQERQACVRKSIEQNGGNLEQAMESCRGNMWEANLSNWAGSNNGEKSDSNKLIDSSAKWAGIDSQPEGKGSLDLVKSLVGDTVVSKGQIRVDYGPRQGALTPRTHLQTIEKVTYQKLCDGIIKKLENAGSNVSLDQVITDKDLKDLSPKGDTAFIDKQTLRSFMYMSPKERAMSCQKLSDAISMTIFANDINRSLDILTTLSQNPNLPENRKKELIEKRRALKESVELTVSLYDQRNTPINKALSQINEKGQELQSESVRQNLSTDAASEDSRRINHKFLDCSDGVLCEESQRR